VINAVIILFINKLDEQFFGILTSLTPKWVETLRYRPESPPILKFSSESEIQREDYGSSSHNPVYQTKITQYFEYKA
jgi:hypothetical protein